MVDTSGPAPRSATCRRAVLSCIGVFVVWAVIAFVVLSPQAPYSGDLGVKFVQARSLVDSGLRSMTLVYPGSLIDPQSKYFPLRPPFVLSGADGFQGIFPTAVALLNAPFASIGGLAAMVALALLSGVAMLWATDRLAGGCHDVALPIVLGLGTCFWFYAVQPWEHMTAVALDLAALTTALGLWHGPSRARPDVDGEPGSRGRRTPDGTSQVVAAGLLLGLGAALRDESLLLVPGLLVALWSRGRRAGALVVACASVGSVLLAAAALDAFVYGRPLAAHALHTVSVVRGLFGAVSASTGAVPTVPVLSMAERYDTVVHYWLAADTSRLTVLAFVVAACLAAALERRSSLGVLALALVVLARSVHTLAALLPAPRWIAGLVPLSPFLVFALFPAPNLSAEARRVRRFALSASALFIALAILTTDTAGGKSLGPRLLLPIVPLITIAAWQAIVAYNRPDGGAVRRVVGACGVVLIALSIAVQMTCILRAYAARNRQDAEALEAIRHAGARVVVADDPTTAQIALPLYFEKTLMLSDPGRPGRELAVLLDAAHVASAVVITRLPSWTISLEPYHLVGSQTHGRVTIMRWQR